MSDKIEGHLIVGYNERFEVVVEHPELMTNAKGEGHIVFSPNQARQLAALLIAKASDAESAKIATEENERRKRAEEIPVDRSVITLANGAPVTDDHLKLRDNGQQQDYIVLSAEERAKGFVRPVRRSYRHLKCGAVTSMAQSIAETYARDPKFYGGTFCTQCGKHFNLRIGDEVQFVWVDDGSAVGS